MLLKFHLVFASSDTPLLPLVLYTVTLFFVLLVTQILRYKHDFKIVNLFYLFHQSKVKVLYYFVLVSDT